MRDVNLRPAARADLVEHYEFMGLESPRVADRFLDNARTTFAYILEHPLVGTRVPSHSKRLSTVRRWPVQGFPSHLVFYRPDRAGIQVLRVLHGASDWRSVLRSM